jgi:hypothetical protein
MPWQTSTTHASLLARLASGSDPSVWQEFHARYAELIHGFARHPGPRARQPGQGPGRPKPPRPLYYNNGFYEWPVPDAIGAGRTVLRSGSRRNQPRVCRVLVIPALGCRGVSSTARTSMRLATGRSRATFTETSPPPIKSSPKGRRNKAQGASPGYTSHPA